MFVKQFLYRIFPYICRISLDKKNNSHLPPFAFNVHILTFLTSPGPFNINYKILWFVIKKRMHFRYIMVMIGREGSLNAEPGKSFRSGLFLCLQLVSAHRFL